MIRNPCNAELLAVLGERCVREELENTSIACSSIADAEPYGMRGIAVDFSSSRLMQSEV